MPRLMAKELGNILIIDDDPDVLLAAELLLKQHAAMIRTEKNPNVIPSILGSEAFDVILLDMNFAKDVSSGKEGFYWLEKILEIDPEAGSDPHYCLRRCGYGGSGHQGRRDGLCLEAVAEREAARHIVRRDDHTGIAAGGHQSSVHASNSSAPTSTGPSRALWERARR